MGSTPYEGYEGDEVMPLTGVSGHVRYDDAGNRYTAADLQRIKAEQERQARDGDGSNRPNVQDKNQLGPLRPSQVSKSGGSRRVSGSRTYDYTGMDEAAKVAQALQAAEGSFIGVAMDDPMKIPQLQNSIRSMQQYLADYHAGRGLPPVRIRSENASSSVSAPGRGRSFTRDNVGTDRTYNDQEEDKPAGGGAVIAAVPRSDAGGPDNQQLVNDAAHGIPANVDPNHDPMRRRNPVGGGDMFIRQAPKGTQQGPPLPPSPFPNLNKPDERPGMMRSSNENKVFGKDDYTSILSRLLDNPYV